MINIFRVCDFRNNCLVKNIVMGILFVIISQFPQSVGEAYGNSEEEYHHIYPRQHYGGLGDSYTIDIKEFEHMWMHESGGFDADWKKTIDSVPFLVRWFSNKRTVFYDEGITPYSKRNAALILGSRGISYNFLTYDYRDKNISGILWAHFDGVSNVIYNVSYIVSIPSKFVHFSSECFKRGTGFFNGSKKEYDKEKIIKMMGWMMISLTIGFFMAVIGLTLGTIIGCMMHPIETLVSLTISPSNILTTNLLSSILDILAAVIYPLWNIVFW